MSVVRKKLKLSKDEIYLGDGLYASFDGFQVCLRAPRVDGDHVVYLEDFTLKNFLKFLQEQKIVSTP